MCILSAYGLVGIASFRQSGIIVTYEVVHFSIFFIRIHSITKYLIMKKLCLYYINWKRYEI